MAQSDWGRDELCQLARTLGNALGSFRVLGGENRKWWAPEMGEIWGLEVGELEYEERNGDNLEGKRGEIDGENRRKDGEEMRRNDGMQGEDLVENGGEKGEFEEMEGIEVGEMVERGVGKEEEISGRSEWNPKKIGGIVGKVLAHIEGEKRIEKWESWMVGENVKSGLWAICRKLLSFR